jgi:hypothetical protein
VLRKIISIDEEVRRVRPLRPSCAEGALQVVDGKLRLVKGAIATAWGRVWANAHRRAGRDRDVGGAVRWCGSDGARSPGGHPLVAHASRGQGCASSLPSLQPATARWQPPAAEDIVAPQRSSFVNGRCNCTDPAFAPFLQDADSTIIADACPSPTPNTQPIHQGFRSQSVAPSWTTAAPTVMKLSQILAQNDIRSLKVVRMEVPCCGGLEMIARQAMEVSSVHVPLETVVVAIKPQ